MIPFSQRHTSNVFNLRHAFVSQVPSAGMAEKDDKDEDDTDDTDEGDGDEGTGETSGDAGEKVDNPEAQRHAADAAKHRNRAKQLQAELDELAAWRKEHEDANKTELEKSHAKTKELEDKLEKSDARVRSSAIRLAFYDSGVGVQFKNPATALRLLDLDDIEIDDEGEADVAEVKKRAEALLKAEPYLGKADSDDRESEGNEQPSGRPPAKKKKGDENRTELEKKFPALMGRS